MADKNYSVEISNDKSLIHYDNSVHEIIEKFKRHDVKTKNDICFQILNKLKNSIEEKNDETFKKMCNLINRISNFENNIFKTSCDNDSIKGTNLIILSCEYNNINALKQLLENGSKTLKNILTAYKLNIKPSEIDENGHNAFYYSIRSNNIELLDTIINSWPNKYFDNHFEELDEILSKSYEELKLKNVLISDDMETFVEIKLIDLLFFPKSLKKSTKSESAYSSIKKRINFTIEAINQLNFESEEEIDTFIYICRFIISNICILKKQLKSTVVYI